MTEAELTILSLLAEGPRYGHEVQQMIDERGLRDWLTIGFSSVHYILNRLEMQKLLTSAPQPAPRGPARKRYEITDAGRGILQTAVADLLRQPRALGTGFELGLINLRALKPAQVYKVLSDHRAELKIRLDLVRENWKRYQAENGGDTFADEHLRALYGHSIALMDAELNWLEQFLSDWLARYPGANRHSAEQEVPIDPRATQITQAHRNTTPDALKLLQKIKRPTPPKPPEGDQPGE